ncbi:hypothetical protein, partial [Flavobacterium sp.]|uniref:hypothetical protein n=1 Tax=Flavobacterium sp. TaxID=239 RepID=UPI00374D6053
YVKELSQGIDDNQARLLGDNEYLIKFSFTPNEKMPSFVSEELLKEYMLKYPMKANGLIELVIDNELVYSVQIINGAKFNEIIKEASFNKAYPCTLTGIRTCAVDGIRNQNWFDMTNCVLEGIGCVANWYGSCIADNC